MKVISGTNWLPLAIEGGLLQAVMDGSYIREHHLDLCSAAFILKCTQGRGCLCVCVHWSLVKGV